MYRVILLYSFYLSDHLPSPVCESIHMATQLPVSFLCYFFYPSLFHSVLIYIIYPVFPMIMPALTHRHFSLGILFVSSIAAYILQPCLRVALTPNNLPNLSRLFYSITTSNQFTCSLILYLLYLNCFGRLISLAHSRSQPLAHVSMLGEQGAAFTNDCCDCVPPSNSTRILKRDHASFIPWVNSICRFFCSRNVHLSDDFAESMPSAAHSDPAPDQQSHSGPPYPAAQAAIEFQDPPWPCRL